MPSETPNIPIAALAEELGERVGDLGDEHERWRIYRLAVDVPASRPLLVDALRRELDAPLATSVVLLMLERLADDDDAGRVAWIELAPEGDDRRLARDRAEDLRTLRSSALSEFDAGWSTWLQRRLAESRVEPSLLAGLAELGATRRIRATAARRLRELGQDAG